MSDRAAVRREALGLFDALLDMTPDDRAAHLAELAAQNPDLATEVQRLLDRDAEAEGVLDRGVQAAAPTLMAELRDGLPEGADSALTGNVIGGFRLIRIIGRGGMGVVWLAERSERGFTQQAALKLLPRGMDSEDLVRRFLRERRILAGLEHPGIARFIDGGMSADGLPWYAMEYVEGESLTEHASRQEIDLGARIALMVQVCDAVAFAQARLVVHRDLKPSNILVDAEGRPRLLDFGIAKLLEDELDPKATGTGMRAMSPAYAAPEQILGESISTATDVYALGVVLYELLTGQLPHRRSGNLQVLSQQVSGESALRPSDALRQASDTQSLGLDAGAISRLKRGIDTDLDSVVMTALRREPERRYGNAAALADDLRAWLERRPVKARPDTWGYRMRRFVRRNTVGVAAAVAVMLALLVGLGAALHQAAEARRQAERADLEAARAEVEAEAAIAQAALAREQAERAKRAVTFLTSLFRDDDPMMVAARGRMSMDEAFEDALARIDDGFDDDPALKADLLDDFGEILAVKGRLDEAETRIRQALALALGVHGGEHPAVAESLANLSFLALMRGDSTAGLDYAQRALAIRERYMDSDLEAYAANANSLAAANYHVGRLDEAAHWLQVALDGFARSQGEDSPRTDTVRVNLGALMITQARYDEAEPLLRTVLAAMERRGEGESAAMLPLLARLGSVAHARGDHEAEFRYAERRLALASSLYPGDHHWHAEALVESGELAESRGDDGLPALAEGVAMYARLGSLFEAEARGKWAVALALRGDHAGALDALAPIETLCAGEAQASSTDCFIARQSRARTLVTVGQAAQALADIEFLMARLPHMFEAETRHHADTLENRGLALNALGREDEAREDFERARDILASLYGEGHASTRRIAVRLEEFDVSPLAP